MPKKKKSIYPLWVLIPALLIYTVFSVVPIVISLVCSFTDWNMGRLYTPAFNGVANYIELLKDPLAMYLGDIYTVAVNLCGLPGITVPCGKDSKGLPIGIQMIGDCFMEKKILRAAHAYETSRGSFAVPGEGGTR